MDEQGDPPVCRRVYEVLQWTRWVVDKRVEIRRMPVGCYWIGGIDRVVAIGVAMVIDLGTPVVAADVAAAVVVVIRGEAKEDTTCADQRQCSPSQMEDFYEARKSPGRKMLFYKENPFHSHSYHD